MEKFQGRHVQQPEIAILKGMRKDISHIVRLQVSVKTLRPGIKMFLFMLLYSMGCIFLSSNLIVTAKEF